MQHRVHLEHTAQVERTLLGNLSEVWSMRDCPAMERQKSHCSTPVIPPGLPAPLTIALVPPHNLCATLELLDRVVSS